MLGALQNLRRINRTGERVVLERILQAEVIGYGSILGISLF